MERRVLRDDLWERIKDLLPGKVKILESRPRTIDCSWKPCCGSAGRGAVAGFAAGTGPLAHHFHALCRWTQSGIWDRVFQTVSADPDLEEVMIDSTAICVHPHAAGAPKNAAHKLWGVLAADSAPRSTALSTHSAIPSASRSRVPNKPTSAKRPPCSIKCPVPAR